MRTSGHCMRLAGHSPGLESPGFEMPHIRRWFGFFKSLVTGFIDLGLLYWDFLPYLWGVSSRLVLVWGSWRAQEILTSIVFCLLLGLSQMVLDLPWSCYSIFVIEQRHGFNKQTGAVFIKDIIKSARSLAPSIVPISCKLTAVVTACVHDMLRHVMSRLMATAFHAGYFCPSKLDVRLGWGCVQVMLTLALGPPLIAAFTMLLQRAGVWLVPGDCQQLPKCVSSLNNHDMCPFMLSAAFWAAVLSLPERSAG